MEHRIFNVHDLFLIITIFEVIILAAYRTAIPGRSKQGNPWLIAFLLVVALDMLTNLMMWNPDFPIGGWAREHLLAYLFAFTHFIRGPIFYFYLRALLFGTSERKRTLVLHALPVCCVLLAMMYAGVGASDLQSRSDTTSADRLASMVWYVSSAVSIAYALVALLAINRYMKEIKQRMSSVPVSEVTWLAVLSICFLVSWAWSFIVILVADIVGGEVADAAGTLHNLIRFLLMNGLIFYNLAYAWNLNLDEAADASAFDAMPVSDDVLHAIQRGIDDLKLHLQPSINIDQFADCVGVSPRVVSQAINRELGTRFFEFINQHRVEHAKSLLVDPRCAKMTILDVLLASGFNNKSSFHRFFNRLVGCSPTQFRREHLPQN